MDQLALAAANTLLGNDPFAATIEIGPFTASFTARDGAVRIALAGAERSADIAGRAMVMNSSITIAEGETLTLGFAKGPIAAKGLIVIAGPHRPLDNLRRRPQVLPE